MGAMRIRSEEEDRIAAALDGFRMETPSWAYANTGTRFGKFLQPGAATTMAEKLSDAGQVHGCTGCCPSVATHVLWDFPGGLKDAPAVKAEAGKHGVAIGSVSPNVFQAQEYKYGSLANPHEEVRTRALNHVLECVELARETESRDITPWLADGSNYPGTANIRQRKQWLMESFRTVHAALGPNQRLLIEYKPFEPAFYHTDIADWGMALLLARHAGPQAKVLVDTGHHYQSQNIEQIVAWLLDEGMLGGFHLNDRRYADDDLTLGSIDPYQVFRIFHEIHYHAWEHGESPDIAYMVDQSHNLKPKIEEMIQTVTMAQELYAKAALVDHEALSLKQRRCELIDAEEILKDAFATDVRGVLEEWRQKRGLPRQPLKAYRESGYQQRIEEERREKNRLGGGSYA
jgi:L-rhamnose isomerase/sugar isomerase